MLHLFLKNIKMTKHLKSFSFCSVFIIFLNSSFAINPLQNQAWFHPNDPSLPQIAELLVKAKSSIDIAMYNMNTSIQNPVIASLLQEDMQRRIQRSKLRVRLIFQGYKKGKARDLQLRKLEDIGIDVRYFSGSKKLHHKFAVIDGETPNAKLITGSANWSLASFKNYNDNILYFASSPLLSKTYQKEFNFLWTKAKSFGKEKLYFLPISVLKKFFIEPGIETYFNSKILRKPTKNKKKINISDYILTHQIVEKINQAKKTLNIATTRIKLFPIYKALLAAAKRGVKINIVVTMAQYETVYKRRKSYVKNCKDPFQAHCSVGIKYSTLLEKDSLKYKNIKIRIKYFDLRPLQSLRNQMHHKYMIIDNQYVLTGSFNWSFSSEFQHVENLLFMEKTYYPYIVNQFKKDFNHLWVDNKDNFNQLYAKLKNNFKKNKKLRCYLKPLVLSYSQIDKIRKLITKYKKAKKTKYLQICL